MNRFSEGQPKLPMNENQEQMTHLKCSDNDETFSHRGRCKFTGDDAGNLFGICVGVFILLASALAYIITIDLAVLLACVWLHFHTS